MTILAYLRTRSTPFEREESAWNCERCCVLDIILLRGRHRQWENICRFTGFSTLRHMRLTCGSLKIPMRRENREKYIDRLSAFMMDE